MPTERESTNATTPRTTGHFRAGWSLLAFSLVYSVTMVPSAFLTASATAPSGVRIMTPSMTAWPPTEHLFMYCSSCFRRIYEKSDKKTHLFVLSVYHI
jgi:hypothetical protein